VVVSPILYDFYNYGPEDRQFSLLLTEFLQVCLYTFLHLFVLACSCHVLRAEPSLNKVYSFMALLNLLL